MPRKKRPVSAGEKSAAGYFRVDETDLKHAVEKVYNVKPLPEPEIIKKGRVVKRKTSAKRKTGTRRKVSAKGKASRVSRARASKSVAAFEPKKINLKKNGYELIITEKPQAAGKIAAALGKVSKKNLGNVSYYEIDRDGEKIYVACAVGHLFTLTQKTRGQNPAFDLYWAPNYMVRKKDFTKRYYDVIAKLVRGAREITVATDYDVEGEVIGLNIVRYLCGQEDANRMKFSTLTAPELNNAYEQKSKHLDWGQAIAGQTRHHLDWIYGINLSRALMDAIKSTGKFKIMSIGRVQGPTLNFIVEKERKIQEFKPQKYWQVFIRFKNPPFEVELKYVKDIFEKKQLERFKDLEGRDVAVRTEKKSQKVPPGVPFNLTGLQMEAYKHHGVTPSRTLQIAQSLYLAGLISYPRTSSQKLPISIQYKQILKKMASRYDAEKFIKREKPVEGKKNDPAHPSIYPTGENMDYVLTGEEKKIYDLIAKRFIALFCDDAVIDKKTLKGVHEELNFSASGSSVKQKGWMEVYPVKMDEKNLPDCDGTFRILNVRNEEKETQPPKRYSPASIVAELEKRNLGTKATRAAILETLYDRNYISNNRSIEATPLGISLISTLEKYSPIIIEEKLTREFEKELEAIQNSTKGFEEKGKKIIGEAEGSITNIIGSFENHKSSIGKELAEANLDFREQQKRENQLIKCPKCGEGNLGIMYSKKTRRYFVACDKYPDCKNTYTLPPNGRITKTEKVCEECGWPMLMRLASGKRPWIFCFNPDCVVNKERIEEYRKKMGEQTADVKEEGE